MNTYNVPAADQYNARQAKHFYHWLATGLAGVLCLTACSESKTTERQPRPVRVAEVQYQQTATTAHYSGEIKARHESPLAFQVGGKLVKRLAEVGSNVERGQLLAILDPSDLRLNEAGATAQLAAARTELEIARKEMSHLANLKDKDLASQAALDKRRDQLLAAEARVAAAQASQAGYARQSAYTELRADQAGVITTADAEPGQIVQAGQTILRLAQPQEKEIIVSIPENRLRDVQTASSLRVNLWAAPDRFYVGRLREISPSVDEILRTYTVKISLPDADADVGMGMTATVHVQRNEAQPVIRLPLTALTQNLGQPAVWIVDSATSTVQPRTVTLAGYDEEYAKLLSGLSDGESVVISGVHKLIAGQKVRVLGARP